MIIGQGVWERVERLARTLGVADLGVISADSLPSLDEPRLRSVRDTVRAAGLYFPARLEAVQLERFAWAKGVAALTWPIRSAPLSSGAGRGRLCASATPAGGEYGLFKAAAEQVSEYLRSELNARVEVFIDSPDICDRSVAVATGIGWWGRSGNVLTNKNGSYVLLGTMLLSSAPTEAIAGQPAESRCGHCVECVRGCPTGALGHPYRCDVGSCLSLVTQSPSDIPDELRGALGARVYGCDICQEVCPVNRRLSQSKDVDEEVAESAGDDIDLFALLEMTDEDMRSGFPYLYLPGGRTWILRRNAIIGLVNSLSGAGSADDSMSEQSEEEDASEVVTDLLMRAEVLLKDQAERDERTAGYVRWGLDRLGLR